ncbi:hypothetical protein [Mycobacteroides abscessus]
MNEPRNTSQLESIANATSLYRTIDDGALAPIDPSQAQAGDIAVFAGGRAGTYSGNGQVRVEGGEWSRATREIFNGLYPTSGHADSIDPLEPR